jgi:hypothetical protein
MNNGELDWIAMFVLKNLARHNGSPGIGPAMAIGR